MNEQVTIKSMIWGLNKIDTRISRKFLRLVFGVLILNSGTAFASFLFPAGSNNVIVLPQKFEYLLVNEKQVQIGNALFDSGQIQFSISKNSSDGSSYRIRISWPASLLTEGQIQIKDSGAKAIWTEQIRSPKLSVQEKSGQKESRADLATYETELSEDIVKKLKLMPFINFCILHDSQDTKVYMCSEELFISVKNDDVKALPRSFAGKEAFVQINGTLVGREGIISLNDSKSQIHFKARTASGAFLEILTGPQTVEFKDATEVADGKGLRIQGRGADPIAKKVSRLSDGDWRIVLQLERPIIYLKGRGGIAFRQEFFVKDQVPSETDRPQMKSKFNEYTYSSSESYEGQLAAGTTPSSKDSNSEISRSGDKNFTWTFKDLEKNQWNQRSFQLKTSEQEFTLANSIFRGTPGDFNISLTFPSEGKESKRAVAFNWNLLYFFNKRVATSVEGTHVLIKPKDQTASSLFGLKLLYQADDGLWMRDDAKLIYLGYNSLTKKIDGASASAAYATLGGEYLYQIKKDSWLYFNWGLLDLGIGIVPLTTDTKMKSTFSLSNEFRKILTPTTYWSTTLGVAQSKFETNSATTTTNSFEFKFDYGVLF